MIFLALLISVLQSPQDTLVHIRNLEPRAMRTAWFQLDADQEVSISAVGGGPRGRSAIRKFLDHGVFQSREDKEWDASVWPANAWILDTRTRQVVWELRTASQVTTPDGLREFEGQVHLPAGTYQVNYAALFPVSRTWNGRDDWRVRDAGSAARGELHGPYLDDGSYRRFQVVVRGKGRRIPADTTTPSSLAALHGEKPKARQRIGFELNRAMPVEVYMLGEYDGGWNDYGSILSLANHAVVWTAKNEAGEYAGGAEKNRVVKRTLQLPAGKYLALFTTDDSHQAGSWNETPPFDPSSWGLTLRVVNQADKSAARAFEYQPVPNPAFATLTRMNDDDLRWQRFAVTHPLDIRVYALGEATGRSMRDYGWIVDSGGHVVWSMEYGQTAHAGGAEKNRVFEGAVHLATGEYTAYYTTDGSHSFRGGWNADEPMDGEYWGMTLGVASPKEETAVTQLADDAGESGVLARLTRMRSDRDETAQFTLPLRGSVRIYAVGEGRREMNDYASIEDSAGHEVWRMSYLETTPAGGSNKNRRADRVLALGAGTYTVRFKTDDSHAWKDWNAEVPDDPLAWGVTVYRASGAMSTR